MVHHSYQLVVVGDHLGGLAAAAREAKRGGRVLLFENTEDPAEERPLEYLNAICGGPDKEREIGAFFHELGLSPFGPLGDDRIHFQPLHPPLQVILPKHRVNIYQDRVARNWEMEREFGRGDGALGEVHAREEAFNEKLSRFRSRRPRGGKALRRGVSRVARYFHFGALQREAEKESFADLVASVALPPRLGDVLAGQVYGVARFLPSRLPWYVGLRLINVLQGGLYQNAAGQSGILSGLKEAFLRAGGECRPLLSLEHIEAQRTDALTLHLSASGRMQADAVIVDLPLERGLSLLSPDDSKALRRRGLDRVEEERSFALLGLKIKRGWKPECMGGHLVIDPSLATGGGRPVILVAGQPGDAPGEEGAGGLEALGIFHGAGDPEKHREAILNRLEALMPFLSRSVVGEMSFRSGRFPLYAPQGRGRGMIEEYYLSGRRPTSFQFRRITFLRNEEYVGTGLTSGLLSGIWAV